MQFQLPIRIPPLSPPIRHPDGVMLIGSCFTEHMTGRLARSGFRTLENPHGVLFNPASVAQSIERYASGQPYETTDLFYLNELWNSWAHHSCHSHPDPAAALAGMNAALGEANHFLKEARWLIITLGSAFQYFLKPDAAAPEAFREAAATGGVANNHRAPAAWLEKRLLGIDAIRDALKAALEKAFALNPSLRVIFTVSPVRHARDGVAKNNRSKGRLLEAAHQLTEADARIHYFPAYELVIDVLRDYRFYDIDLVHPNYAATDYVWERFRESCIDEAAWPVMREVESLNTSLAHRPRFPETVAHQRFLAQCTEKKAALLLEYPYLNISG